MAVYLHGVQVNLHMGGTLMTQFVAQGVNILASAPEGGVTFLLKFDGTATTNATTSVRELVNAGTSGVPATLYGGQGLEGDGTMYIDTGVKCNMYADFTFIVTQEVRIDGVGSQHGFSDSWASEICIIGNTAASNELIFKVGDSTQAACTKPMSDHFVNGDMATIIGRVTGTTSTLSIYKNGEIINIATQPFAPTVPTGNINLFRHLFKSGSAVNYSTVINKDFYYIPSYVSDADLLSHCLNPERTLYWEDVAGTLTLKSDLPSITPEVILDMQSGNGFWYPLCENTTVKDLRPWITDYRAVDLSKPPVISAVTSTVFTEAGANEVKTHDSVGKATFTILANGTLNYRPSLSITRDALIGNQRYFTTIEITTPQVLSLRGNTVPIGTSRINFVDDGGSSGLSFDGTAFGALPPEAFPFDVTMEHISTIIREAPQIQGMSDPNPRLNAQQIEYGLQMPLLEYDAFGVPTGLSDNLVFKNNGYVDANGVALPAQFEIEFYLYYRKNTVSQEQYLLFNNGLDLRSSTTVGSSLIATDFGTIGIANTVDNTGAIYHIAVDNNTLTYSFYQNNVSKANDKSISTAITNLVSLGDGNSDIGSFRIYEGVRTPEERTASYQALTTKHGIV